MHRRLVLVGKTLIACSFSHELNRSSGIVFRGKAVGADIQLKSPNLSWQLVAPYLCYFQFPVGTAQ